MKKLLLLGDSIRENYQDAVTAALAGALSAHFPGVDFVVSQTANPIKYM